MRFLRKMCSTFAAAFFVVVLLLFLTIMFAAACSQRVTMSFETFGGTKISSICVDVGNKISSPNDPEKEGFVFLGWYLDKDCSGEAQTIPTVMPSSSVTYYAKYAQYPKLTLQTDGGTLERTQYYVKEGTNLLDYLNDKVPVKDGLVFDAWYSGDQPVGNEVVMTEDDFVLSARYLAKYTVEIRKQRADGKEFDVETTYGYGKVGDIVSLTPSVYEHFEWSEEQSTSSSRSLQAGENLFVFTYLRERHILRYLPGRNDAWGEMQDAQTYYQGECLLPESRFVADGYVFLGWAESSEATQFMLPGESYSVGEEDVTLYAVWATEYCNGRGDNGKLLVACNVAENGDRLAILTLDSGTSRGSYCEQENKLQIMGTTGRLEHHTYLLSDSGTYIGYDLSTGTANARYGTLTLNFEDGCAVWEGNGEISYGQYVYEYSSDTQSFTGRYYFQNEQTEFPFILRAGSGSFLKQGKENGTYSAYNTFTKTCLGESISFDGLGNAVCYINGERLDGCYVGTGTDREWIVELQSQSVKVLLQKEIECAGETILTSNDVYLAYNSEQAGTFIGDDSSILTLDGYGAHAEYFKNGEMTVGMYEGDGRLVVLSEQKFVLKGNTFYAANREAGYYDGEMGKMFLDGAGCALIDGKEYSYRSLQTGDWQLDMEKTVVRFQTDGAEYRCFDESLFGVFLTLGGGVDLDGYGNGKFVTVTDGTTSVRVGREESQMEIFGNFTTLSRSLSYAVDYENRTLTQITAPEVGRYALVGTADARAIRLDGSGNAMLYSAETVVKGTYSYENGRGVFVLALNEEFPLYYFRFRLNDGKCSVYSESEAGMFSGENCVLTLDGYGGGSAVIGLQTISGDVVKTQYEITLQNRREIYRFSLQDQTITGMERFFSYRFPNGTHFYVGETTAYFEDGKVGTLVSLGAGEYRFTADDVSCIVLLEGDVCYCMDETISGARVSKDGCMLALDAYGKGTMERQDCVVVDREQNCLKLLVENETVFVLIEGNTFQFVTTEIKLS